MQNLMSYAANTGWIGYQVSRLCHYSGLSNLMAPLSLARLLSSRPLSGDHQVREIGEATTSPNISHSPP